MASIEGRSSSGNDWQKSLSALWKGSCLMQTIRLARTNLSRSIRGSKWPSLKWSRDLGSACLPDLPLTEVIFRWWTFLGSDSFLSPPTRERVLAVICKRSRRPVMSGISGSSDSSCTPTAVDGMESNGGIFARSSAHPSAPSSSR